MPSKSCKQLEMSQEDPEALAKRLQKQVPFLRQMLVGLCKEGRQYQKIKAICDILEKANNVKYATLVKCDRVLDLLKKKKRGSTTENHEVKKEETQNDQSPRAQVPVPIPKPNPKSELVEDLTKPVTNPSIQPVKPTSYNPYECIQSPDNEIQSPDDDGIRSPDITDTDSQELEPDRYLNTRPSIYSVVAESIQTAAQPALTFVPPKPVVPEVDTSKPPISAQDLQQLLLQDDAIEDGECERSPADVTDDVKIVEVDLNHAVGMTSHKSKVSLVPTPFHKKVRKPSSGSADDSHSVKDKHTKVQKRNDTKSAVKSDADKNSKDARAKETKDKVNHKSKSKVDKVVESSSIFGSLLSSLDEKFIADKECAKDKPKVRRDSKDSEPKYDSLGSSSSKHSKDKDRKTELKALLDKLASKIKTAEKDMAAALKKTANSEEEETVRKKYNTRIERYQKERNDVKRKMAGLHSSKHKHSEKKDKNGGNIKTSEESKTKKSEETKSKNSEDSKIKNIEVAKSKKSEVVVTASEAMPKTPKSDERPESAKTTPVATVAPMSNLSGKYVIRKKTDDKSATGSSSKSVTPLEPPPLPLGFHNFNPFANETAEINRLNASRKNDNNPRSPLHEVGNDFRDRALIDPRESRDSRDPRDPRDSRDLRDTRDLNGPRDIRDPRVPKDPRDPRSCAPVRRADPVAPMRPPAGHFAHQNSQFGPGNNQHPVHPMPGMQVRPKHLMGRWEPPPSPRDPHWAPQFRNEVHQNYHPPQHAPNSFASAEFRPFAPIGNEYDLDKMGPTEFYTPSNQFNEVQNYRQWRQLKERNEEMKRKIEEEAQKAEDLKKMKEEEFKKRQQEEEDAKQRQEEEAARKKQEEEEAAKRKQEEEAKKRQEEAKKKQEEEAKKAQEELEKKQQEEEARIKAEETIKKEQEELLKKNAELIKQEKANEQDADQDDESPVVQRRRSLRRRVKVVQSDSEQDESKNEEECAIPNETEETKPEVNIEEQKPAPVLSEIEDLDLNNLDRNSLLKLLGKAKQNQSSDGGTYLPKLLDLMETFLQKQETSSMPDREVPDNNKIPTDTNKEPTVVASSVNENMDLPVEPKDLKSEEEQDNHDQNKNEDNVKETGEIMAEAEKVDDPITSTIEGEDSALNITPDPICSTRARTLRRRTKSINYSEVKISDTEESPKRKRRTAQEMKEAREKEAKEKEARELEAREREAREMEAREREAKELEAREREAKEMEAKERAAKEKEAQEKVALEVKPQPDDTKAVKQLVLEKQDQQVESVSADQTNSDIRDDSLMQDTTDDEAIIPDNTHVKIDSVTHMNEIIEGIANGTISIDWKAEEALQRRYVAEYLAAVEYLAAEQDVEKAEAVSHADPEITPKSQERVTDIPKGVFEFNEDSESNLKEPLSKHLETSFSFADTEVQKIVKEKPEYPKEKRQVRPRKSELEILHQDIKDSMGDGIMGSLRRSNSASSRASSPGSVLSNASSCTKDCHINNLDLKDVKLSPAADEILKKLKHVRVVVEKLPDTHEVNVPARPKSRLARKCKTPLPKFDSDSEKSLESSPEPNTPGKRHQQKLQEDAIEPKKLKLDVFQDSAQVVPNKNYFIKCDKNDPNPCHLCDFNGPQIITHYLWDHPESEVLISRLSPDATQEAFEESIINDYSSLEVTNIGGKKFAKFDFRCRFCSNDLQKELTSTFYDHVSSHTGEGRYHCTECLFKHHVKSSVKEHITFAHGKHHEPLVDEPPKNFDKLFGYICSECNFLQLRKQSISEHIERHHKKDTAYVYTINMSLPILRFERGRKEVGQEMFEQGGSLQLPAERRLRSSQRLKKAEFEKSDTSEQQEEPVQKKTPIDKQAPLRSTIEKLKEKANVVCSAPQREVASTSEKQKQPAPSSAFVCDNWDELLKKTEPIEPPLLTPPKRNSGFLDTLKKRLEEQLNNPDSYESPFIDKEVENSSEIMGFSDSDDADTVILTPRSPKVEPEDDTIEIVHHSPEELVPTTTTATKSMLENVLLSKKKSVQQNTPRKLLYSVGVIDAMTDDNDVVSFVCRLSSCIFKTSDARVYEVHCIYTHANRIEMMNCSVCPTKNTLMPLIDAFSHLSKHVESYLQSKQDPPIIKIELDDTVEEDAVVEVQPQEEAFVLAHPNFKISKVESLASTGDLHSSSGSTPSPVRKIDSALQPQKPKAISLLKNSNPSPDHQQPPKVQPPILFTCKIVPMHRVELEQERKSEQVMKTWKQYGLLHLFKCPKFDCFFVTMMEAEFEQHLIDHDFKDAFIPCLYCNYKMRQEFLKVHLMMRHAQCSFYCGHCLYRARRCSYLPVHHALAHPEEQMLCRQVNLDSLNNRYRPPSLPHIRNIMKPHVCACSKIFYVTKHFAQHREHCDAFLAANPNWHSSAKSESIDGLFMYNCRYCTTGAVTPKEIFRHIAIEHPFHDLAIVCRQDDSLGTANVTQTSPNDLLILTELPTLTTKSPKKQIRSPTRVVTTAVTSVSQAGPSIVRSLVTPPLVTATAALPTKILEKSVQRIMLVHPAALGIKQSAIIVAPTATATLTTTTPTASFIKDVPAMPALAPAASKPALAPVASKPALAPVASEPALAPVASKPALAPGAPVPPLAPISKIELAKPADTAKSLKTIQNAESPAELPQSVYNMKIDDLFKCNQCSAVFAFPKTFLAHLHSCKNDSDKPYVCAHCKKSYKHAGDMVQHVRMHGKKNISCGLCGLQVALVSLLKKHVKEVHKLSNIHLQPADPTKTNIEVDHFIGKPLEVNTVKGIVCLNKLAPTHASEADEDRTHFGPEDIGALSLRPIFKLTAICKICQYSSKVRSNFIRHMNLHTSGLFDSTIHKVEAVNPVPCLEKNELMFDKMTNLAASSFEGRMGPKPASATSTGKPSTAGVSALASELLDLKVPDFIPEYRRYVCGAAGCNYLCLEESNLRHHLQALHDNESTYTCSHCKEVLSGGKDGKGSFIDIDAIVQHLRLHEPNLYKCPYCDLLNSKSTMIEKHCGEKHADKAVKYTTIRQIIDDKPGVSEKPKKPWKCGVCTCRRFTEEEIRLHCQEKHTMQTQYKCIYCSFKDDNRAIFKQHFAQIHPHSSPDIIVSYYKDGKEEVAESLGGGRFDTTPLWVKNRDSVKHIRGILLDEEATAAKKSVKTYTPKPMGIKRRSSAKLTEAPAVKIPKVNTQGDVEEILLLVEDADVAEDPLKPDPLSTPSPNPPSTPLAKPSSSCEDLEIIDIPDDDEVDFKKFPNDIDYPSDPSLQTLFKMPMSQLISTDFVSTYGPFGRPTGAKYVCPICKKVELSSVDLFKQHIFDELQYNRHKCVLCGHETTNFTKMHVHYSKKHLTLCDDDSVASLEENSSIELWLQKVLLVQTRIIVSNKATMETKRGSPSCNTRFKCSYCGHKVASMSSGVAHSKAAHSSLPVRVVMY